MRGTPTLGPYVYIVCVQGRRAFSLSSAIASASPSGWKLRITGHWMPSGQGIRRSFGWNSAIACCSFPRLWPLLDEGVLLAVDRERDRDDHDDSLDDLLRVRVDARDVHPGGEDRDHEDPEHGAVEAADAAGERGAADDDRGDRVEQEG